MTTEYAYRPFLRDTLNHRYTTIVYTEKHVRQSAHRLKYLCMRVRICVCSYANVVASGVSTWRSLKPLTDLKKKDIFSDDCLLKCNEIESIPGEKSRNRIYPPLCLPSSMLAMLVVFHLRPTPLGDHTCKPFNIEFGGFTGGHTHAHFFLPGMHRIRGSSLPRNAHT